MHNRYCRTIAIAEVQSDQFALQQYDHDMTMIGEYYYYYWLYHIKLPGSLQLSAHSGLD